ncbi:MAG: type II toxin-antitoxin system antitoxin SocA domain-containing protein [bacterium]
MVKKKDISRFTDLVCLITNHIPGILTLQLVKTIYFLELEYKIKFGENLTEVPIVRLPKGPVSSNYKSHFKRLENEDILRSRKIGQGVGYFCTKSSLFTEIELEIFEPVLNSIAAIRDQNPGGATEIIKGLSYQTLPMQRFVEREKEDQETHIGWKVLEEPYFLPSDIDELAEERRALREHLRKAHPFSKKDAALDVETLESLNPFLKATNQINS